jgi:hypothetical protein
MRRSPHSVDDQNAGEYRYYVGGPRRRPGKAEKGIFRLQRILFEGHAEGEVLDVMVQTKRNKRAALKLMRKLLKKYGFHFVFFTWGSRPRLSYRKCIRWRF